MMLEASHFSYMKRAFGMFFVIASAGGQESHTSQRRGMLGLRAFTEPKTFQKHNHGSASTSCNMSYSLRCFFEVILRQILLASFNAQLPLLKAHRSTRTPIPTFEQPNSKKVSLDSHLYDKACRAPAQGAVLSQKACFCSGSF